MVRIKGHRVCYFCKGAFRKDTKEIEKKPIYLHGIYQPFAMLWVCRECGKRRLEEKKRHYYDKRR